MIIDATTPIAPDIRGDYGQELDMPPGTAAWRDKLSALIKGLPKRVRQRLTSHRRSAPDAGR